MHVSFQEINKYFLFPFNSNEKLIAKVKDDHHNIDG